MRPRDPDVLRYFFEDISQIPILEGMEQILPLTRRILRGKVLRELPRTPTRQAVQQLLDKKASALRDLEALGDVFDLPRLDADQLANEVEHYLDAPDLNAPAALAVCLEAAKSLAKDERETFIETAWSAFYRVASLPPSLRLLSSTEAIPRDSITDLRRIRREGRSAKRQLVQGTLRYPITIARLYLGRGFDYLELVNEGVLGLMTAAEKYREWRGVHFQGYAAYWIQQGITRAIADKGRLIRTPVHLHDEHQGTIAPLLRDLEAKGVLDCEPAIAEHLGWTPQKTRKRLRYYRTALQPVSLSKPHSYKGRRIHLENILCADLAPELIAARSLIREEIEKIFELRLDDRASQILRRRFGLETGEVHTLEEIAQGFGLTRERIRQIEAAALRTLQKAAPYRLRTVYTWLIETERDHSMIDRERSCLSRGVREQEVFGDTSIEELAIISERKEIEASMERLVPRGVRGVNVGGRRISLTFVVRAALEQLGKPTHHLEILETAKQISPGHASLTRERVYACLFYTNKQFRRHGNGVFGLVEWGAMTGMALDDGRLQQCPAPLLPPDADPTVFFETVLEGAHWLGEQTLSAREFWARMTRWLGVAVEDDIAAQSAFDAWYAAGLIDRIHFSENGTGPLHTHIAQGQSISEMRRACTDMLCKRIDKMPELLAYLGRVLLASTNDIRQALFGSAHAGHDVPNRLLLLTAFGAVTAEGSHWRLTDLGRAVLEANPPDELPDLEVEVESNTADPSSESDNYLDLLFLLT